MVTFHVLLMLKFENKFKKQITSGMMPVPVAFIMAMMMILMTVMMVMVMMMMIVMMVMIKQLLLQKPFRF